MTTTSSRADWLVPTSLVLLTFVPAAAGALRLTQLAGGGEVTADNARYFATPLPVVLHIISVTLFCLLGAFQFAPGFRRRHRAWHRVSGRVLVPAGLTAALTGLWMQAFYPPPAGDGLLIAVIRYAVGTAMIASIVLGFRAILRRDVKTHSAWMIRGYAIGLGAGTQVFTHLPWAIAGVTPSGTTRALLMAAGWVINILVAEWIIRRKPARSRRAVPAGQPVHPAAAAHRVPSAGTTSSSRPAPPG
ncbi:MAG: DUF2306 domain-containing protein [Umezawaea sp.]